ncbi:glucosaminidase domain-containing protein [Miltoncostaea oceani]|uniref:glucosaminidase domain-containing protein n=1 Tax=Miltoncostaea oceani TaxID=2843216 RepID=UPI001C3D182A|nr:glucosaminidase domain-containing protein [Miltoncostaea oceani]
MSIEAASGLTATLARIREITGGLAPAAATTVTATTATTTATGGAAGTTTTQNAFAAALDGAMGTPAVAGTPASASGASPVTGAQLDAWMASKNPGAPLVGLGDVFVREGVANGIDPRALVAIARAESSLGSDPGARSRNNAFGWGPHRTFASWEENIATVARGLRTGYLDDGLVTLPQIQARYAPLGVGNDPTNLNSNWLRNTTTLYRELGGDPAGSVALGGGR